MRISLLYTKNCPHRHEADANIRAALTDLGWGEVNVERIEIRTAEHADLFGFRGSPTVLLDGEDPFADPAAPIALACRLYATDAGLVGTPTVKQLRAVLPTAPPAPEEPASQP